MQTPGAVRPDRPARAAEACEIGSIGSRCTLVRRLKRRSGARVDDVTDARTVSDVSAMLVAKTIRRLMLLVLGVNTLCCSAVGRRAYSGSTDIG